MAELDSKQIDRELDSMEGSLAILKRDYEVYFSGGSRLPPYDSHKKLEKAVRGFSRVTSMNYSQRFRYNNLTARFNSFSDLWTKQMRYREEGRTPSGGFVGTEKPKVVTRNPDADSSYSKIQKVFNDFVRSRQQTGEGVENLDFEKFAKQISSQKKSILDKYQCKDVEFSVSVEGGRAKVKARIVK